MIDEGQEEEEGEVRLLHENLLSDATVCVFKYPCLYGMADLTYKFGGLQIEYHTQSVIHCTCMSM